MIRRHKDATIGSNLCVLAAARTSGSTEGIAIHFPFEKYYFIMDLRDVDEFYDTQDLPFESFRFFCRRPRTSLFMMGMRNCFVISRHNFAASQCRDITLRLLAKYRR